MTIAISIKVHEGLVLAADSASTVVARQPDGQTGVVNVYNNANKVFNLLKGLPIAAVTWGVGAIGESSMSMLMKDLRLRFSGEDLDHLDWAIKPGKYSIEHVATLLRRFVYEENYVPFFSDWPEKPDLGFFVVGYSSGATLAEEYQIDITQGNCGPPRLLRSISDTGTTWSGATEPLTRLLLGFSPMLPVILQQNLGIPPEDIGRVQSVLQAALNQPLVQAAMPLQDAIDLASFLTDVAIRYYQFAPGAPVVGGPVEIAAISKHEGFKWVQRKYYFNEDLNPSPRPGDHGSTLTLPTETVPRVAKKATAKKTPARKATARKAPARKATAKKAGARRSTAPKTIS